MLNKIKGIKVECESFLEHGNVNGNIKIDNCSPIIDNNNYNHGYDNNNNNDFLYGLINKLSPDSNISELFSQSSATINDDQCCYSAITPNFPTIDNGLVKVDNLSENNNNYSIINNGQNYQFLPINNTNIKLPSLQTSSSNNNNVNPYVHYVNDFQYVKNEEFVNYQSSIKSIDSSKYSIENKIDNSNIDNNNIDESQRRRVERKRERNREAARKCREKKNSLIENLEAELCRQRQQIEAMRGKVRLVVREVERLSRYIEENIPGSDYMRECQQFIEDNDLQQCLEVEKANVSTQ